MRKGLTFLFLVALLLQGPTMGEAANWVKVGESASNSPKIMRYIDADSVQTTKSGAREAWEKTTYDPPDPRTDSTGKKVYAGNVLSFTVYTNDKYYCSQEIVEYYTNGSSASYSFKCELKKIPPDTIGEAIWKFLFK